MPEKISNKNNNNLFTNKNFVLLLLINIFVIFSDKLVQIPTETTEIKGNHIITTIILILPYIFFAPLAGYLADKYKKKDILFKSVLVKLGVLWIVYMMILSFLFGLAGKPATFEDLLSHPNIASFFSFYNNNPIFSILFFAIFLNLCTNKHIHLLIKIILFLLSGVALAHFTYILLRTEFLYKNSGSIIIFLSSTVAAFINIITLSLIPNIVQKSNLRSANALIISLNILLNYLVSSSLLGEDRYFFILIFSISITSIISLILVKFIKLKEKNQLSVNKLQELLGQGKIKISEIDKIHSLEKSLKNQYQVSQEKLDEILISSNYKYDTFYIKAHEWIKQGTPAGNEIKYKNIFIQFTQSFKSTITYLKTHQKTKRIIELACALSLLTSVFYIALIALAQDKLNTFLIMIGSGMLLGVIGINFLQNKFKLNDLLTFSFIVLVIAFGTAQFVNSIEMAWFWLIPIGIVNVIINMLIETAIQKTVPNRFRGKVFGFKAFITNLIFVVCLIIMSQFVLVKIPPIELIHGLAYFALAITLIILFFRRNFVYYVLRLLFKPIMYSFFQLKIKGREHLKHKGSLILAGNHTGWLDGFIVGTASKRNLEFMVTSEVLSWPIIRHVARALAFIPVFDGQGKNALKEAIDDLKCGKAICIFPEGKLSEDGSIAKFNRGVARLQTKSQAPIIPFAIHGGFEAWSYHHKLPRFHKIIIEFGEPLYYTEEKDEKSIIDELRQKVIDLKNNLL